MSTTVVSSFDFWVRLVLPICTFVLGIVATFLAQRYWKRTESSAQSAQAIAELTADWYNQLDALAGSLKRLV
jgi:uncharacterized membrane protein YoaK (UPF0700 family)